VQIEGAALDAATEAECVRFVLDELDAGRGGSIETMNVDHLLQFVQVPSFAALCGRATLVVADGMPLVWASRLLGTPLPERVTGADLLWSLSEGAKARGRSVFLLGGEPGTAERAAQILVERFPALRLAGTLCLEIRAQQDGPAVAAIGAVLATTAPDIVFVALGAPKQELLIELLRGRLHATWWVGVGGAFSFACGAKRRAPAFMRHAGLEWLYRLGQEPRRLARRYLVRDLPFAVMLLVRVLLRRLAAH
jgi:N-acetylglucosaminyldiphosphoundecaprenol N-acetyl-beta-D-mannosaminyltransferase